MSLAASAPASLSALVRSLSSAADAAAVCADLTRTLQQCKIDAASLVQLDVIPPLLLAMQEGEAAGATTAAAARSSAATAAAVNSPAAPTSAAASPASLSTLSRRLLHQLQLDSQLRLFEMGWSVATDRHSGRVDYRQTGTAVVRQTPPPLPAAPAAAASGDAPAEPEWVSSLLLELPLLTSAHSGGGGWPLRVRHHAPASSAEDGSCESSAISVVDVQPWLESSASASSSSASAEGISRHLVIGAWHGVGASFRESEADLSYAPGEHLESWYAVTLAAVGLLATTTPATALPAAGSAAEAIAAAAASSPPAPSASLAPAPASARPPRLLLIGLGGGTLASFLALYAPSMQVDVVELDSRVVRVAQDWFGLRVRGEGEGGVEVEDKAIAAGFASPSASGAGCVVHVSDALAFLRVAPAASFDVVLVDVYTSGVFPPALLTAEFFALLRRVVGAEGSVATNAGVGADRAEVERLFAEAFGVDHTRTLLDRKEVQRSTQAAAATGDASIAAENAVVLCGSLVASLRDRLNTVAWRRAFTDARLDSDSLRPLPFELAFARNDDASASADDRVRTMQIEWKGAELDKVERRIERRRAVADNAKLKPAAASASPAASAASQAAWALFD